MRTLHAQDWWMLAGLTFLYLGLSRDLQDAKTVLVGLAGGLAVYFIAVM